MIINLNESSITNSMEFTAPDFTPGGCHENVEFQHAVLEHPTVDVKRNYLTYSADSYDSLLDPDFVPHSASSSEDTGSDVEPSDELEVPPPKLRRTGVSKLQNIRVYKAIEKHDIGARLLAKSGSFTAEGSASPDGNQDEHGYENTLHQSIPHTAEGGMYANENSDDRRRECENKSIHLTKSHQNLIVNRYTIRRIFVRIVVQNFKAK